MFTGEEVKFQDKPPVDRLLDQDDCSIDMLLEEPSILQECKSQNPRLMELCALYSSSVCLFLFTLFCLFFLFIV